MPKLPVPPILAIDPATKCGWACSPDLYGVWNLSTKTDESWGMKLLRFESKLRELHNLRKFKVMVYERPGGRFARPQQTQAKIIGVIEKFCAEHDVEYRAYSSKEIKKYATGNGNAGKPLMITSAKEKYGYEGKDDNEADSLHLWHLAVEDLGWKK